MKKLITTTLACTVIGLGAYAQGTLNFANINGTAVNAPIHLMDGTTKVTGSQYIAALLAGPSAGALAQIATSPFLTGGGAGYFTGGSAAVPTVAGGGTAFIQVDVWDTTLGGTTTGATDAQAKAYWLAGHGNVWGASSFNYATDSGTPFSVVTANPSSNPPGTPSPLVGLTSFSLAPPVPEPSTFALAGLGAAALMIFRRRK